MVAMGGEIKLTSDNPGNRRKRRRWTAILVRQEKTLKGWVYPKEKRNWLGGLRTMGNMRSGANKRRKGREKQRKHRPKKKACPVAVSSWAAAPRSP